MATCEKTQEPQQQNVHFVAPPLAPASPPIPQSPSPKSPSRFLDHRPFSLFRRSSARKKARSSTDNVTPTSPPALVVSGSSPAVNSSAEKGKSFPRSTTLPSITYSDTATLSPPTSQPIARRNSSAGANSGYDTLKVTPGSQFSRRTRSMDGASMVSATPPPRSLQVSAITMHLQSPSKAPISIRMFLKGREYRRLPFIHGGDRSTPLRWEIKPPLTIRSDSNLLLEVRKRRRWPKDPLLAEVVVVYEEAVELVPLEYINTFPLTVSEDPSIVLDIVPADPETLQSNLDLTANMSKELRAVLEGLGRSREFFEHLIAYGTAISEIDPIAKAVLNVIKVAHKHLKEHEQCNKVVYSLAEDMARTLGYIEDVEQFARLAQLKRALEEVRPLMEDTVNLIGKYIHRSTADKFWKTSVYRDEIEALKRRYLRFQQQFDRGLAVQSSGAVEIILKRLESSQDDQILRILKPKSVELASYPSEGCMPGTRLSVLSFVEEWVHDLDANNVLWIRGFPGVGKSAIAATIVIKLRDLNRLGARFVFQRDREMASTPNALWRSIAYQLARTYPSVRKMIVERIREDDVDVETSNVKGLFRELVEEPLLSCTDIPVGRLPVVVIDALDECGGRAGRNSSHRVNLLQTVKRWANLPTCFKLIVTSRIEDDISSELEDVAETVDLSSGHTVIESASTDIRLFLTRRLGRISKQYDSLPDDWPDAEDIEELTHRAAGLFLWAKTAVEFIDSGEPTDQLRQIMDGADLGNMAQLYAKILAASFPSPSPDALEAFQEVVGAMIFAKRPLTGDDCQRMLRCTPTMLEFIQRGLRSVLDQGPVLRFSHQSFAEFLLQSETCPTPFRVQEEPQHRRLAAVSLEIMLEGLRFNISKFPTSHIKNTAVPDLEHRIQHLVGSPLTYASRYWMEHVAVVPFNYAILDKTRRLLHEKLLCWFEVLSLIGEIWTAPTSLLSLRRWAQPSGDTALFAFIDDACKFLEAFGNMISQSAPHIYISALPFAPENSLVGRQYRPHFPKTVKLTRGRSLDWSRIVYTVDEHTNVVTSVSFSHDGKYIVSTSQDKTVRVWDAETGDLVSGPMESHTSYVATAAFSPDRRWIASGSDDCTLRFWDAESGEEIGDPVRGHTNAVTCVAFSPKGGQIASASLDGTVQIRRYEIPSGIVEEAIRIIRHPSSVNTIAFSSDGSRLVTGSSDRLVRVWDSITGTLLNGPFEGHTNSINCVVFSPDATTVASASEDETIQLWDLLNDQPIGEPLEGHTDAVTSIAFSPDGRYIVSGAYDGILLVWGVDSGAVVCEFTGHRNGVTSVAWSPDGKRILSGACDEAILVWDADVPSEEFTLAPILMSNPAHQDNVKSISFSPDGKHVATGSDDETLRVWDAETGVQQPIGFHRPDLDSHHWHRFPLPPTHKHGVEVVLYSPDGRFIASAGGLNDETVCIWISRTGELHVPPLHGHSGGITSLAWFPDSARIASSSYDNTVRVWDVNTGENVAGPYAPHSSWVTSITITADGATLASASRDRSICTLDAETLRPLGCILRGHTGPVNSIAFTPNPRLLASGSTDRSVRLWDVTTGEMVWHTADAHTDVILSLACSRDGQYIASTSRDKTIKLWNVETGRLHLGPLEGHTGAVFSAAFNYDGTRLASSAEDETVRLWDICSTYVGSDLIGARPAEFEDDSGYQNGWIVRSRGRGNGAGDRTPIERSGATHSVSPSASTMSVSKDEEDSLLLWVPPWSRSGVWWPRNTAVIAEVPVKLDLGTFVHGEEWARCAEPLSVWT